MKAIILAAGRGKRMHHLTEDHPKCLLKVKDKTLLDWQLDALKSAGISEVGIVTGYKRELLSTFGLVEFYNSRWKETDMMVSLICANDWLSSEPCIISYSDIFYESSIIFSLIKSLAPLSIAYDPNWLSLWKKRFIDPLKDAETFRINQDYILLEIGKKPKNLMDIQGQYIGLLKFTPVGYMEIYSIFKKLSCFEQDKIQITNILQKVIEVGNFDIESIAYCNKWGEVDSIEDLKVYNSK